MAVLTNSFAFFMDTSGPVVPKLTLETRGFDNVWVPFLSGDFSGEA